MYSVKTDPIIRNYYLALQYIENFPLGDLKF